MAHLAGEIAIDYQVRLASNQSRDELISLVHSLAPKLLETNAESEAVDLLLEVD